MRFFKFIAFIFFIISDGYCSVFASQINETLKINNNLSFSDTTEKQTTIKALSYNLRFGELASLEKLADFIKKEDPDVVALQEVDSHTFREKAPHQNDKDFATELGFLTGMFAAYGKTIQYKGGYYGIALLSKYPIAKVKRIYLPKTKKGKEQRAILIADIEYCDNTYFTFASTHLDYTNTEERQGQVQKINEIVSDNKYPVILGGDFNASPDSKEIEVGMRNWKLLSDLEPTFRSDKQRTIDYIFAFPKGKWSKIEASTYDVKLSDHYPIGVLVEMK